MSGFRPNFALFALGLAGVSCAPPATLPNPSPEPPPPAAVPEAPKDEPGVVRFFERRVDLKPFLAGFPYKQFTSQLEDGRIFYVDARETYRLLTLPIAGETKELALDSGTLVTEADFSQRSLFGMHYVKGQNQLWIHGDEKNDERLNLYRVDLDKSPMMPVAETDHDYLYDWGFSEDDSLLGYLPRTGTKAPFDTCVHVRDLEKERATKQREERKVLCDTPALRFTWGRVAFSKDKREVFFSAQSDDDRNRVQLVRVNLADKKPKLVTVTDPKQKRTTMDLLEGTLADGRMVFVANDDGYANLYTVAPKSFKVAQLTRFTEDIESAQIAQDGAGVFVSHGTPAGTTIELITADGKSAALTTMAGQVHAIDAHGDTVLWTYDAPDVVFGLMSTHIADTAGGAKALETTKLAGPSKELEDAVVACKAEAVRIPTFDQDPKTGKARELHAFLLSPKRPLSASDKAPGHLAMVRSFYGGENVYTQYDHIMCAAGVTILSPSVRGSSGFGKDFFAMNDGDLGGNEIVDLFYAARWLEQRTKLPASRIGVYGRSHGGFATMRAMTFPPATNGRNDSYPFGFGLAEAGFSDIEAFYKFTNIPDWVVLEAGNPAVPEELAKIRDRSPLYHVDLLNAPIFLLHGENDWRVPVQGSRAFAEAAKAAGKPVTYVEVKGQGHRVEGLERIAETFQQRFDFLMSLYAQKEYIAPASMP